MDYQGRALEVIVTRKARRNNPSSMLEQVFEAGIGELPVMPVG